MKVLVTGGLLLPYDTFANVDHAEAAGGSTHLYDRCVAMNHQHFRRVAFMARNMGEVISQNSLT